MEIRELTEADLPSVLELCNRALPLDEWSLPMLRRRLLHEPNHNSAYQLCLWDGPRLVGMLLGGTRASSDAPVGTLQLFAIDPAYQRRGLASQLLGELEQRMRADGLRVLRVGGSAPSYIWPGLDVRYTPAFCLLQRHGYERTGDAFNMEVDLIARDWNTLEEEARLAAEGFEIRRLEPADRSMFSEWLLAAWGPVWQWEATNTYENNPVSTFVALKDGHIRAFASYNATAFPNGFGPTGTDEALRGKGVGRVLLHRCFDDLRRLGYTRSEICWVGPIAFYARSADAWINRVFWFLEKKL